MNKAPQQDVAPVATVAATGRNDSSSKKQENNQDVVVMNHQETARKASKPYCDICWKLDGFRQFTLQTCRMCHVSVHNECYGIAGNENVKKKDPNFLCWACKSIGMTIKVRERDRITKKRLEYTVTERPTECILCSVDDGMVWPHAMHPVYDNYGRYARQIVLEADVVNKKPKRLAWAHTLCAFIINSRPGTGGCVYGCTQDGVYAGQNDWEEEEEATIEDDDSMNSLLAAVLDDPSDVSIHHFAYCLPERKAAFDLDPYIKIIEGFQNELRCSLCGKYDNNNKRNKKGKSNNDMAALGKNNHHVRSYRIPLQCCANEVDAEFEGFLVLRKKNYPKMYHGECFVPAHVGCAMWHKNDDNEYPRHRRVFYYPGSQNEDDEYSETVKNVYCDCHTEQLGKVATSCLRYPRSQSSLIVPSSATKWKSKSSSIRDELNDEEKSKQNRIILLEKRRARYKKQVDMIRNDIGTGLSRFTVQQCKDKVNDYNVFVRAKFEKWKLETQTSIENYKNMFNEALRAAEIKLYGREASLTESVNTIETIRAHLREVSTVSNGDVIAESALTHKKKRENKGKSIETTATQANSNIKKKKRLKALESSAGSTDNVNASKSIPDIAQSDNPNSVTKIEHSLGDVGHSNNKALKRNSIDSSQSLSFSESTKKISNTSKTPTKALNAVTTDGPLRKSKAGKPLGKTSRSPSDKSQQSSLNQKLSSDHAESYDQPRLDIIASLDKSIKKKSRDSSSPPLLLSNKSAAEVDTSNLKDRKRTKKNQKISKSPADSCVRGDVDLDEVIPSTDTVLLDNEIIMADELNQSPQSNANKESHQKKSMIQSNLVDLPTTNNSFSGEFPLRMTSPISKHTDQRTDLPVDMLSASSSSFKVDGCDSRDVSSTFGHAHSPTTNENINNAVDSYVEEIVIEILARHEIYSQERIDEESLIETVCDEIKAQWKTRLLSVLTTIDQYNEFWEQVFDRVCAELNYHPHQSIDWSFLLNGDEVFSPTGCTKFLDEWDTYQEN